MSESRVPHRDDTSTRPTSRRRLWLWVLSAVALATVAVVLVLSFWRADGPAPAPSTGSPTSTDVATSTPSPTSGGGEPSPAAGVTEDDRATIVSAITSRDTGPIASYLADPTTVILCATEAYGPLSPELALADIDLRARDAELPWDFALAADTIDEYRASSYAQHFPIDALVGRSADGQVFAFGFTGVRITNVFWCGSEQIVVEE